MFLHCIVLHIQRWPQCNIRSEWLPHLGQEREKNFLISDKKSLDVRSLGGLIIAVQYPTWWPRSRWTFQETQSCSFFIVSEVWHRSRLLFGIAAHSFWPSNSILCNQVCSLWHWYSFLSSLSYHAHVHLPVPSPNNAYDQLRANLK